VTWVNEAAGTMTVATQHTVQQVSYVSTRCYNDSLALTAPAAAGASAEVQGPLDSTPCCIGHCPHSCLASCCW
jgi:hypothetical protein